MNKNKKNTLLSWLAVAFCGCGSLLIASIAVAGTGGGSSGGGTGSNYNGCQSATNRNASTCFGLSWRYYKIPDDITGNITIKGVNGTGGNVSNISETCKEYGGGFYFLGFEGYGKADSWENASSIGYNIPKMSLGQFLTGEINNPSSYNRYEGGDDVENPLASYPTASGTKTGLTSVGGAKPWDEVQTAYNDAKAKYPAAFRNTGEWNTTSTLIWFCADDGDTPPPPEKEKTAYFEGRTEATITVDGTSRSGSAGYSSSDSSALISLPVSAPGEEESEKTATVTFNYYIRGRGDKLDAVSYYSYNDTYGLGSGSGNEVNDNGPGELVGTVTKEITLSTGSSSICGRILFDSVEGATSDTKSEVCINVNVPSPEYNVLFYGDTGVRSNGTIKVVELDGLEDVVESTTPDEDGTYTIRSGVSLDGKTIKVLNETAPLSFSAYIQRIDNTTKVDKANTYYVLTTPEVSAFTNPTNLIQDLKDASEGSGGLWDSVKGFFSNFFQKIKNMFGGGHATDFLANNSLSTPKLSIGETHNFPGTSGDYPATSSVTEYCINLLYVPSRNVNESGTDTIWGKITNFFGELVNSISCLLGNSESGETCDFSGLFSATGEVAVDVANKMADAATIIFGDDDTMRFETRSCVGVQQALNFRVTPSVSLNDSYVFAGESINIDKNDSRILSTPYHEDLPLTRTSPLTVQIVHFTVDADTTLDFTGTDKYDGEDVCNYFGVYGCTQLGNDIKTLPDGKSLIIYPFTTQEQEIIFADFYNNYEWTIQVDDNASVGDLICVAAGVKTANSEEFLAGNKDVWAISGASCVPVAKKPSANIINGGVFMNGSADTTISYKNNNSGKVYGSWVQYDITANGSTKKLASGSKLLGGIGKDDYGDCKIHPLTIANEYCSSSNEVGYAGLEENGIYQNVLDTFKGLVTADSNGDSAMSSVNVEELMDENYGVGISNTYGIYVDGDLTVGSETTMLDGATGRTIIIYATGDIRINKNLKFGLMNSEDIPQIIIISDGNIEIADNVTEVDAWLVAEYGVITADNHDSSDVANAKLTVNGPIFASYLRLNRTGGSEINYGWNHGTTAETFNFSPTTYIWLYQWMRKASTRLFIENLTEMAPRY